MANIDDIFQKSNLDENQKKSKMLFGRMLISLRTSNHIKLYSLLESVNFTDIQGGILTIVLSDKTAFDIINNQKDKDILNETLKAIDDTLSVEIKCDGKEPFDVYKFENKLKEEFGKILTIKK